MPRLVSFNIGVKLKISGEHLHPPPLSYESIPPENAAGRADCQDANIERAAFVSRVILKSDRVSCFID